MEIKITTTVKLSLKEMKEIVRAHLLAKGIHATDNISFHVSSTYSEDSIHPDYGFDYVIAEGYIKNSPDDGSDT